MGAKSKHSGHEAGTGTLDLFNPARGESQDQAETEGDGPAEIRPLGRSSVAAGNTTDTAANVADAEVGWPAPEGREPYNVRPLDLAHAMVAQQKFAEHPFRANGRGEAICPACSSGMLQAEKRDGLAAHFICAKSGLAFYGDRENLFLCLNPALDVAGQLRSPAVDRPPEAAFRSAAAASAHRPESRGGLQHVF